MYKTKTEKKKALRAINQKAMKLFTSGVFSMKDAETIGQILKRAHNKLWRGFVVARKKDAEEDAAAKAILDQLQTKTVGPPPTSTGLIGDQQPETVFSSDIFDQIKNQVTLQLSNVELLNVLNTIGQVSNTQSQSGPLVGTQKIVSVSSTGTAATVFRPDPGQVWELVAISQTTTNATGSTTTALRLSDGSNTVMLEEFSDNSGEVPLATNEASPIRVSYDNFLTVAFSPSANADSINAFASVIRVRWFRVPRLPVDGKKVIEHRISLGGVEREALKSLATSYRIQSLAGDDGILNELGSVDNVIGKLAVAGFLLELFGITDVFDFDDEAKAKAGNIKDKIIQNEKDAIAKRKVVSDAEKDLLDRILQGISFDGRLF
jgi:hypothetical protein